MKNTYEICNLVLILIYISQIYIKDFKNVGQKLIWPGIERVFDTFMYI